VPIPSKFDEEGVQNAPSMHSGSMTMLLLRFRASNHRSLRDAVELSLAASGLRGASPSDGDWIKATTRVAGIYGANASGKSTILHAMDFVRRAVMYSATRWGDRDGFPFHPFLLNSENRNASSTYELDVVIDEVRYTYGFESSAEGIVNEWLLSYPKRRPRLLFERSGLNSPTFRFSRTLPGENTVISKLVRPATLFLSVAANNNHPLLGRVQQSIAKEIRFARYGEANQSERLRFVRRLLEDPDFVRQTEALLRYADLGIASIAIEDHIMVDEDRERMITFLNNVVENTGLEHPNGMTAEQVVDELGKGIRFAHRSMGRGDEPFSLSMDDESSGTVAWLSLSVPALFALKHGTVFLIDEIDSSLHPRLTAALIGMFKDPVINKRGAQLIFTSHDTALLGPLLGDILNADEVWFTDKQVDGNTELYALVEFPNRQADNYERRYLQGRYGAVPMVAPDELRFALAAAE
jgi:uncharacterized protein